jgi:type IV pilus assembly protein PilZ
MPIRKKKAAWREPVMQPHKHRERRKHPRKACAIAVDGLAPSFVFKAFITNISPGGVFIQTPDTFAANEEIVLIFPLPYHEERIKVAGKVLWNAPGGLGVAFQDTPDGLATMIESLA